MTEIVRALINIEAQVTYEHPSYAEAGSEELEDIRVRVDEAVRAALNEDQGKWKPEDDDKLISTTAEDASFTLPPGWSRNAAVD